jgi:hypothetical protein
MKQELQNIPDYSKMLFHGDYPAIPSEQQLLLNRALSEVKVMLGDESVTYVALFNLRVAYEVMLHGYLWSSHLFAVADKELVDDPKGELFQTKLLAEGDWIGEEQMPIIHNAIKFIEEKYGVDSAEVNAYKLLLRQHNNLAEYARLAITLWCVENPDDVNDVNKVLKQIHPYTKWIPDDDDDDDFELVKVYDTDQQNDGKDMFAARYVKVKKTKQ